MSSVFRTLFDASTVRWGLIRAVWARCLAECHELVTRVHVRGSSRSIAFLQTKEFSSWKMIDVKNILKIVCFIVWHVSTDCNGTFGLFLWTYCSRLMMMDYWAERANNKEEFGHKLWTLSNKSNIYCGTGIPGSAFWWRSSKVSEYL